MQAEEGLQESRPSVFGPHILFNQRVGFQERQHQRIVVEVERGGEATFQLQREGHRLDEVRGERFAWPQVVHSERANGNSGRGKIVVFQNENCQLFRWRVAFDRDVRAAVSDVSVYALNVLSPIKHC